MDRKSNKSLLNPFVWLAVYAGCVGFMLAFQPGFIWSCLVSAVISLVIILYISGRDNDQANDWVVPVGGAALLALFTWIAVLLVPLGGVETNLFARVIAVIAAATILMPIMAFGEMIVSAVMIQTISRAQGKSVLGGELRLVSLVDKKFGGLLGGINR